jgi:hypothetical protein
VLGPLAANDSGCQRYGSTGPDVAVIHGDGGTGADVAAIQGEGGTGADVAKCFARLVTPTAAVKIDRPKTAETNHLFIKPLRDMLRGGVY